MLQRIPLGISFNSLVGKGATGTWMMGFVEEPFVFWS